MAQKFSAVWLIGNVSLMKKTTEIIQSANSETTWLLTQLRSK